MTLSVLMLHDECLLNTVTKRRKWILTKLDNGKQKQRFWYYKAAHIDEKRARSEWDCFDNSCNIHTLR